MKRPVGSRHTRAKAERARAGSLSHPAQARGHSAVHPDEATDSFLPG
jgi:hypothetical protein